MNVEPGHGIRSSYMTQVDNTFKQWKYHVRLLIILIYNPNPDLANIFLPHIKEIDKKKIGMEHSYHLGA